MRGIDFRLVSGRLGKHLWLANPCDLKPLCPLNTGRLISNRRILAMGMVGFWIRGNFWYVAEIASLAIHRQNERRLVGEDQRRAVSGSDASVL